MSLTQFSILIYVHLVFIYLLVTICGNFTLESLICTISARFWFNGALYFSFKNLFVEKVFELISVRFLLTLSFSREKYYILYLFGFFL